MGAGSGGLFGNLKNAEGPNPERHGNLKPHYAPNLKNLKQLLRASPGAIVSKDRSAETERQVYQVPAHGTSHGL